MSKLPDAICFCPIRYIFKDSKFNVSDKIQPSVSLTGLPIDARDKLFNFANIDSAQTGIFLTSPLCGLDEVGIACACAAERSHKPLVYGFSHSVSQPVNAATVASIWLSFSAGLLVAKIKLKAENEFFSYGCFYDHDFIELEDYLSNMNLESDMYKDVYAKFLKKDLTAISAFSELVNIKENKIKPWLYSFTKISEFNWRFPSQALSMAASTDCLFLSNGKDAENNLFPKIDRSHWRLNAFDPVVASIHGHCAKHLVRKGGFFASKNGIVGKKEKVRDSVAELWQEMMDLSKSLVSERVKWDSSKSAVRSWYAAKLRKYNNG